MWFSAALLFRSIHNKNIDESDCCLWEENIVLIEAEYEAEAEEKAESIGKKAESDYESSTGDVVKWKFEKVERIYSLDSESLTDGTEVFSRFLRNSEVESLLTPFESSESKE